MFRARRASPAPVWLIPVVFAGLYAVFAAFSLATTQTEHGIALIWPSSGVLYAGLLLSTRQSRLLLLALIAPVSMAVNMAFGATFAIAAGLTLANVLEGAIAVAMACGLDGRCGRFDDPRWIARFVIASVCASAASALIASVATGAIDSPTFLYSWFKTVFLGMLIVAPVIVTGVHTVSDRTRIAFDRRKILAAGLFATVSIVATFGQTDYPLLFLPVVAIVFVTFIAGVAGALVMICAITIAATISLIVGTSPITFVSDPLQKIYFTQFYLLTIFASSLPPAALLARSRAQMAEIELRKAQHDAAQAFAHVGHWRYCLRTNTSQWSDGMFAIYGLDPKVDRARNLEHGSIVEELEGHVRETLKKAVLDRQPFTLAARILNAQGESRYIESAGDVEIENGKVVAIFGVLKDVTNHVTALRQLAVEKERAEALAQKSQRLSETDQLTGIANRRKLLDTLGREIARSEREHTDLSILMIDVDHFKSINDRFGHAVGDEVLKRLANLGSTTLRKGDLFGRLGGEEFLAILPSASAETAAHIGERLRRECEELDWPKIAKLDGVTISLGVAMCQFGYDETSLLHAADTALYESKRSGRNRLTIADRDGSIEKAAKLISASRR